ncbi:MAG: hypothetical protein ACOX68_02310 [Candidatus Limivicinus sp.]
MKMAASLVLFVLFVIIYIVISDIITIFFRLTGMTEEKARFQVISLLTNSGFTTRESEAVVSSKLRRRLARATMLFGYAFTVTIVSTTVNFFMSLGRSELNYLIVQLPVLLIVLVAFNLLRRSAFFKTKFDSWIEKIGNKIMFGENANSVLLVEDYGETVVAHILLHQVPEILKETPLSESVLRSDYNIMVMMVVKPNGEAHQADPDTVLRKK